MPALSFQREFVDALLRGDKQQTTRPQTERFKVGDTAQIYIEQRRRITEKPLRQLTEIGYYVMERLTFTKSWYPAVSYKPRPYHAHFLGKVEITEIYVFKPWLHKGHGRHIYFEMWARADGFDGFSSTDPFGDEHKVCADEWFTERYDDDWMQRTWTVIRWNGWQERYFETGEV